MDILYCALPFTPRDSILYEAYEGRIPVGAVKMKVLRGSISWTHLSTTCNSTNSVTCIAFSIDGECIASGSHDNIVNLWNAHTGARRHLLKGHTGALTSVTFSADSDLASGSEDGTVRIWNTTSGTLLKILDPKTGPITCVAFSHDGFRLVSSTPRQIQLWNVTKPPDVSNPWDLISEECFKTHLPNSEVTALAFFPNGTWVAYGTGVTFGNLSTTGGVFAWDTEHGWEHKRPPIPLSHFMSHIFGPQPITWIKAIDDNQHPGNFCIFTNDNRPSFDQMLSPIPKALSWCLASREIRIQAIDDSSWAPFVHLSWDRKLFSRDGRGGRKWCGRVPKEYMLTTGAEHGDVIALGCMNGQILILDLSTCISDE